MVAVNGGFTKSCLCHESLLGDFRCEHDLAEVHEKFNPTHFIRLESIGPLHLRFQGQGMVHTPLQSTLNSVTRSASGENKYKQEAVHTL